MAGAYAWNRGASPRYTLNATMMMMARPDPRSRVLVVCVTTDHRLPDWSCGLDWVGWIWMDVPSPPPASVTVPLFRAANHASRFPAMITPRPLTLTYIVIC